MIWGGLLWALLLWALALYLLPPQALKGLRLAVVIAGVLIALWVVATPSAWPFAVFGALVMVGLFTAARQAR